MQKAILHIQFSPQRAQSFILGIFYWNNAQIRSISGFFYSQCLTQPVNLLSETWNLLFSCSKPPFTTSSPKRAQSFIRFQDKDVQRCEYPLSYENSCIELLRWTDWLIVVPFGLWNEWKSNKYVADQYYWQLMAHLNVKSSWLKEHLHHNAKKKSSSRILMFEFRADENVKWSWKLLWILQIYILVWSVLIKQFGKTNYRKYAVERK